jgi:DNA polymerase I-like protein with 3'-5' exonuclease and polymerase domains
MVMITVDLETNLSHDTIWCAGVQKTESPNGSLTFDSAELKQMLSTADGVVGHNIIFFDKPVLKTCWQVDVDVPVWDTLVMARLLDPTPVGGHSLKEWGRRIGIAKMDFDVDDFDSGYTDEMGEYCIRDVEVTTKLYHYLTAKLKKLGFSDLSIKLEHEVSEITAQQVRNGFKLDMEVATKWQSEMAIRIDQITAELQDRFPPIITIRVSDKTGKRLKDHVEEFNVGSRQQIAKRLSKLGVKWKKLTPTGSPVVDESTLAGVDIPEAKLCAEYLGLVKLKGMVDSWLKYVDKDTHRIHGYVNSCGAVTGRMTHNKPNLAQIPSLKIARQCFTVDEGNVLVGCDASGLELRCLAHYMNDDEYTRQILEGDIHSYNQHAAGLPERSMAKTMIYGLIYGAGDAKLGQIVGGGAKEGKKIRDTFLTKLPALRKLIDKAKGIAERTKRINGIDGRFIKVDEDYKVLNRLLQSCGAIVMKVAVRNCCHALDRLGVEYKLVAQVHDELQIECAEHDAELVGGTARQAIIDAGVELNMRCPMDAEYRIGSNWSETH